MQARGLAMIRRIVVAAFALALGGCAIYDSNYRPASADGSYRGNYDGGFYAAPAGGYGDYYYDRPEVVVNEFYGGYGYPYTGFGYGFGYFPGRFGFGVGYDPWYYRPWYGYGDPYGWHRRWPHHHAVPTNTRVTAVGVGQMHGVQMQSVAAPGKDVGAAARGTDRIPRNPRRGDGDVRYQRDPIRSVAPTRERNFDGAPRAPRHESSGRPFRHDATQR